MRVLVSMSCFDGLLRRPHSVHSMLMREYPWLSGVVQQVLLHADVGVYAD